MASNGLKWPQMASNGLKWPQMASNGLKWSGLRAPVFSRGRTGHNLKLRDEMAAIADDRETMLDDSPLSALNFDGSLQTSEDEVGSDWQPQVRKRKKKAKPKLM